MHWALAVYFSIDVRFDTDGLLYKICESEASNVIHVPSGAHHLHMHKHPQEHTTLLNPALQSWFIHVPADPGAR